MNYELPKDDEWEVSCLDSNHAFNTFHGKSYKQAQGMFRDSPLSCAESLHYMNKIPFQYYLYAFIAYLKSDGSKYCSDAASCFLYVIDGVTARNPEHFEGIEQYVNEAVIYVCEHQDFYDARISIYGDFKTRVSSYGNAVATIYRKYSESEV